MKKVIFTMLIAFVSSLALYSCTEEEVAPKADNGGGRESVTINK